MGETGQVRQAQVLPGGEMGQLCLSPSGPRGPGSQAGPPAPTPLWHPSLPSQVLLQPLCKRGTRKRAQARNGGRL